MLIVAVGMMQLDLGQSKFHISSDSDPADQAAGSQKGSFIQQLARSILKAIVVCPYAPAIKQQVCDAWQLAEALSPEEFAV